MSSASSSRRRSRASLAVACLSLALVSWTGDARAAAGEASIAEAGHINWAQVAVRVRPSRTAARLTVLTQFRADFRPRVVFALGIRRDAEGRPAWYRISVPGRPNGRTGWIPAASVALRPIEKEIVIDRSERTLELRNAGRVEFRTRVAVGARGMETPLGRYFVVAKFRPTAPILGAYAFETSAYSKLSEWPGGGVVGLHGTNSPSLLGQAVSHGCIRVANAAILRLKDLVPVGTPIRIVP